MRRSIAVWSAVSLVLLLLSPSASAEAPEKESWIVTLAPGVDPGSQAEGLARQVAGEHAGSEVRQGPARSRTPADRSQHRRRVEADRVPTQQFPLRRVEADCVPAQRFPLRRVEAQFFQTQ